MNKAMCANLIEKAETYAYMLGYAEYYKQVNPCEMHNLEYAYCEGRLTSAMALLRILQLIDDTVRDSIEVIERQNGYNDAKARYEVMTAVAS
jgi:hypothetical protein